MRQGDMMEEQKNTRAALIIGVAVALALIIVVAYALAMNRQTTNESTAAKQPTAATDESLAQPSQDKQQAVDGKEKANGATITFTDAGFSPRDYTVKKGETVTVKNNSSMQVQFSSDDHPTHTKEQELNLTVLSPGESASFTPTKTGTWGFHDHLNDQFTGTLKVTE